jgi:hypothetical protein
LERRAIVLVYPGFGVGRNLAPSAIEGGGAPLCTGSAEELVNGGQQERHRRAAWRVSAPVLPDVAFSQVKDR